MVSSLDFQLRVEAERADGQEWVGSSSSLQAAEIVDDFERERGSLQVLKLRHLGFKQFRALL
jgi:hypothetical protein